MTARRPSQSSLDETPIPQLNSTSPAKSAVIVTYLQDLSRPSLFNRELSQRDYELWDKILAPCSEEAIHYAFQRWMKEGKTFPKPSNIMELVLECEKKIREEFKPCGECEEGWKRETVGFFANGKPFHSHFGAMKRCQCFYEWKRKREQS